MKTPETLLSISPTLINKHGVAFPYHLNKQYISHRQNLHKLIIQLSVLLSMLHTKKMSSPGFNGISLLMVVISLLFLAPHAIAFMPYRASSLLDLMPSFEDPFRILEQAPFTIPKPTETLALAQCDWKETPTAHVITLDVPGLGKGDLKIEVEDKVLRISGERKVEKEEEKESWHRVERAVGKFMRQFRMPGNANVEGIKARMENGVLMVTVPKVAEEKKMEPKVIGIEEGGAGEDVKAVKSSRDEM